MVNILFLEYIEEPDKEKKYKKASDCGWYDPHNNFFNWR